MTKKARQDLTAERLRELLSYDPEADQWKRLTGRFAGEIAGSVTKKGLTKMVIDGEQYLARRLKWLYLHGEWPPRIMLKKETYSTEPVTEKECGKCGLTKPIEQFVKAKHCLGGRTGQCKPCKAIVMAEWKAATGYIEVRKTKPKKKTQKASRIQNVFRKYNITPEFYDDLHASQGGVCALCRTPGRSNRWGRLSVDHCHETGLIRGLLCAACNSALGMLGDTEKRIQRALDYVGGRLAPIEGATSAPSPQFVKIKKFARAA